MEWNQKKCFDGMKFSAADGPPAYNPSIKWIKQPNPINIQSTIHQPPIKLKKFNLIGLLIGIVEWLLIEERESKLIL